MLNTTHTANILAFERIAVQPFITVGCAKTGFKGQIVHAFAWRPHTSGQHQQNNNVQKHKLSHLRVLLTRLWLVLAGKTFVFWEMYTYLSSSHLRSSTGFICSLRNNPLQCWFCLVKLNCWLCCFQISPTFNDSSPGLSYVFMELPWPIGNPVFSIFV